MLQLSDIDDIFTKAESKIKKIEHLGTGLTIPAVNQLRYVACHLLRFDRSESEEEKQEELRKAENHCERAIYDAVEVGILDCLKKLRKFQDDYRKTIIPGIVPNYLNICQTANEANEFISKIKKDDTKSHRNNRGEHYEKCGEYFDTLNTEINKLNYARLELNKIMNNDRDKLFRWLVTIFVTITIGILGIIVTIILKS